VLLKNTGVRTRARVVAAFVVLGYWGGACGQTSLTGSGVTDGGAVCGDAFAPPVPSATMPTAPGCYEGGDGGWIPVLCLCQLPINNEFGTSQAFMITLDMTSSSPAPSFGGALQVSVAFDDPEANWYTVWAKSAANGSDYTVTATGGQTTIQLGAPSVSLPPVTLAACGARLGVAAISGTYAPSWNTLSLNMIASIDGRGTGAATTTATCPAPVPLL
jgi:hypothetical protein